MTVGDRIPDPSPDALQRVETADMQRKVNEVLASLPERERRVIEMRFGFGGTEQTGREIALQFGVSHERIFQIEEKGLQTLAKRLKPLRHCISLRRDPVKPVSRSNRVDWNEEAEACVRKYWATNLSTKVMAAEASRETGQTITKNAFIAAAHRLKLPSKPSPIRRHAGPV